MRRALVIGIATGSVIVLMTLASSPVYTHKPITTTILYKKEIAQIFQRKCFQCHSENNLAMSLTTYEVARPWARAIREEVIERRMPPWGAVTGFGHFSNDVSLTQREMDIILSWADGGAPSGVLKVEESIPPVYVPATPQWEFGEPGVVLPAEKPFVIEPGSGNRVERFEVRAPFAEPRAVKGLAFRPGDRRVVRYASVYESPSGRWLWTWTPWQTWMNLPDGVVYRLPARARFTIEVGYRAIEERASDKSELGLYFSDTPAPRAATALVLSAPPGQIAPGRESQRVRAEMTIPTARRGLALWPELGEGAKTLEVRAIAPDGVAQPLVWVKDIRADWPTPYVLREPVSLTRGTRIVMSVYYGNAGEKPIAARPRLTFVTANSDSANSKPSRR